MTKIPKFRYARTMMAWLSRSCHPDRLPAEIEEVFFKRNEQASKVAEFVAQYGLRFGPLDSRLESLLVHNNRAIVEYSTVLHKNGAPPLPDSILERLKGDDNNLLLLARRTGRLPSWLEDTLTTPKTLVNYAANIIVGRLPQHLEELLVSDVNALVDYAFKVIRGLSPIRLPDNLHSVVVLKSFEHTDNITIKKYFEEVSRAG